MREWNQAVCLALVLGLMADSSMCNIEKQWETENKMPDIYKHYVDDTLNETTCKMKSGTPCGNGEIRGGIGGNPGGIAGIPQKEGDIGGIPDGTGRIPPGSWDARRVRWDPAWYGWDPRWGPSVALDITQGNMIKMHD